MSQLVLVFLGSGLGAIARHKLGGLVLHHSLDWRFPLGTFFVNVVGCLVAGILAGAVERRTSSLPIRGCSYSLDYWAALPPSPRSGSRRPFCCGEAKWESLWHTLP